MRNIRKSAFGTALKVALMKVSKAGARLVRPLRRQWQIRALKKWYSDQLRVTEEFADLEVTRYMMNYRQNPTQTVDTDAGHIVEWSEGLLRQMVRRAIVANEKAQLAQRFNDRLSKLDAKSAYLENGNVAKLMQERDDVIGRIDSAGYPSRALYSILQADPPE